MTFSLLVYVRVKFRAFGITFGTVQRLVKVARSPNGHFTPTDLGETEAPMMSTVLDRFGILLKVRDSG